MTHGVENIVTDCSVAIKWELTAEPQAAEATELFLDWQHKAVLVHAPQFLLLEVVSALARAQRQGRITDAEATKAVTALLGLPYTFLEVTTPLVHRAYEIAIRHQQKVYDCAYVALAEQRHFVLWTGDQRLFNALSHHFPLLRWIGDYKQKRP